MAKTETYSISDTNTLVASKTGTWQYTAEGWVHIGGANAGTELKNTKIQSISILEKYSKIKSLKIVYKFIQYALNNAKSPKTILRLLDSDNNEYYTSGSLGSLSEVTNTVLLDSNVLNQINNKNPKISSFKVEQVLTGIASTPRGSGSMSVNVSKTHNVACELKQFDLIIEYSSGLIHYWNGSQWVEGELKYWNGTEWVDGAELKYWNGNEWVEVE